MRFFLFTVCGFLVHVWAFAGAPLNLPVNDADFGCFENQVAQKYIQDFSINLRSFGGMELCDSQKDTKKLFNDIYLIENTIFTASEDHSFIRGFVARDQYYNWMKENTFGVNRGNDIPYATAYNRNGYFTMQDGWSKLSTLGRVGTIIHEARHTEGYSHRPCTFGPYANSSMSGCDLNYQQGGSHAVEMEYYARVVIESKNLHPVYQSMARLMAMGRSNFVFNDQPIKKREALLGLTENKLILEDSLEGKIYEREIPRASMGSKLKRTSFGASLVAGNQSVAIDLIIPSALNASISDDYSYFKILRLPFENTPNNFIDAEEVDFGMKRYFLTLNSNGSMSSFLFPSGKWNLPSAPSSVKAIVTRLITGEEGLFGITEDGTIYPYDLEKRRFKSPISEKWPNQIATVVKRKDQIYFLGSDGFLKDIHGTIAPEFSSYRFTQMVNIPLYDTFEVRP